MAKFDMKVAGRYLALGAGAVAMPSLIGKVGMLSSIMSNAILQTDLLGITTVGNLLLAAAGVWVIDQLILKR